MDIALLLILIVLNGVFAMSELALVAARRTRLTTAAAKGSRGAAAALNLKRDPTRFLSTVQIGITTISILNGVIGAAALARPISSWLNHIGTFGADSALAETVATGLAVVIITYLSIVIGELVPKRIAQVSPARIAILVAKPMDWLARISGPFVWLLSASTEVILRLLGIREKAGPPITEEEIHAMLAESSDAGVIERSEHDMVRNVFNLDDRRVGTFMTPRRDMVYLDIQLSIDENLARVANTDRSRFPVVDGDLDHIVGIIQTKALVGALIDNKTPDLAGNTQPALFVPESLSGRKLLDAMRESKATAALVVDEYGDLQGLVTINDLMTAIAWGVENPVGKQEAVQREDGSWLLDGMLSTLQLRQTLLLQTLPDESPAHYESLGGMLMTLFGHLPTPGELTEWEGWIFEVVDLDGRRIDKVLARRPDPKTETEPEPESTNNP
ncbi:MAG: hemolysin family protein [Burkholderiaceae bacterium]